MMESDCINKGYFVSDGNVYDGKILGDIIKKQLGKKTIRIRVPNAVARLIAMISEAAKYIIRKPPLLNLEKMKELESINWKCDIQPLIDDFNFKPEYDLNRGVHETVEWYKKTNRLK